MSIHTAIREFTEKYNSEAISSIEQLPAKVGMRADMIPFTVFNLKESCENFSKYLKGYCEYMKLNKDNPKKTTREGIKASMENYIANPELFKECEIKYDKIPFFVKTYLESVTLIQTTVDTIKDDMEYNDIELEYVGDVDDYANTFLTKLNEKFDPIMTNILWASGYAGKHKKTSPNEQSSPAHKVTFL